MLSEEQLHNLATDYFADQWAVDKAVTLMKEIEAEVRKQDDALILQLVEALDDLAEAGEDAWSEERPCVRIGKKAITAGRARLGEKT